MVWKDFMCELEYFKNASERVKTLTTKSMSEYTNTVILHFYSLFKKFKQNNRKHITRYTFYVEYS